jgi:hypothetical protein
MESYLFTLTGMRDFAKGMDNLRILGRVNHGKKKSHTQTTVERTG